MNVTIHLRKINKIIAKSFLNIKEFYKIKSKEKSIINREKMNNNQYKI